MEEFVQETGLDRRFAQNVLQESNWCIKDARKTLQPLTITEASIRPQPTQYGQEKPHIQGSLPPIYTSSLASVNRTQRAGGRPPGMLNVHQHHQQHYCDSAVASLESSKDFTPLPSQLVGAAHYVGGNNSNTTQVPTVRSITGGASLAQSATSAFSNGAPLRATAGGSSSHFFHASANYDYGDFQRCKGSPVERIVPIQVQKSSNSGTSSQPSTASVSTNTTPEGCQFLPLQQERVPKLTNSAQDASVPHIQPDVRLSESDHKLKRGISNTVENVSLVSKVRNDVLQDIEEASHDHMYTQTFVLPDLSVYSEDFRIFLERDLVETSTLVSLEQAGRLNWWATVGVCQRLMPMATTGDGNCLLHAASLAMWGVHDRDLILRKALYDTMTKETYRGALYRRWRWQQTLINKESGLIFSEEEWKMEWNNLLKLASPKPRTVAATAVAGVSSSSSSPSSQGNQSSKSPSGTSPVVYESLEEFHVFVLAHVLQRPIIVVADTVLRDANGEALAPIPFGGIYLPLECSFLTSNHTPLLLTYDAAHFSALVPMTTDASPYDEKPTGYPAAIPLVDPSFDLLPIHFPIDPGEKVNWKAHEKNPQPVELALDERLLMLQRYLELERLPITHPIELEDAEGVDQKSCGSYESDQSDVSSCGGGGGGSSGGGGSATIVSSVSSNVKEKKKDLREKRMSQQMQTVAKQFGSISKTMGKKLKKNFSIGKPGKPLPPEISEKLSRPTCVGGGVTQSTKLTISIAMLLERDKVLCARLSTNKTAVQKELIRNYLFNANKRFEKEVESRRKRGEEPLGRCGINRGERVGPPTKCVTSGCNMYGTPETSYLCSKCFSQQKQQALNQEKSKGQIGGVYNTYPCHGKRTDSSPVLPSGVQTCGKSKFYTTTGAMEKSSNTDATAAVGMVTRSVLEQSGSQTLPAVFGKQRPSSLEFLTNSSQDRPDVGTELEEMRHLSMTTSSGVDGSVSTTIPSSVDLSTSSSSHTRIALNECGIVMPTNNSRVCCRTPSPDYDNVEYLNYTKNDLSQIEPLAQFPQVDPISQASIASLSKLETECNTPIHCLTEGCEFYGSLDRNSLCSKCYKDSQKTVMVPLPTKPGKN